MKRHLLRFGTIFSCVISPCNTILRALPLCAILLLAGCTSGSRFTTHSSAPDKQHQHAAAQNAEKSPPAAAISETSVAGLSANTPMTRQAISHALRLRYQLLEGMQLQNGAPVPYIEARLPDKPALDISGNQHIRKIEIYDPALAHGAVSVGTPFSSIYQQAYNVCRRTESTDPVVIQCRAPGSQHISYLFSGQWQGPGNLLPDNNVLKDWRVSKIIWQSTPFGVSK